VAAYPYVSVSAYDVTNVEARGSVELRFGGEFALLGVAEQDIVDVVKAAFAQQPNVTANAIRYEVTSSSV